MPFYLRTGKRLAQRHTEITIQFKKTPFDLFRNAPVKKHSNQLVIQIQPVEGISLSFERKNSRADFARRLSGHEL